MFVLSESIAMIKGIRISTEGAVLVTPRFKTLNDISGPKIDILVVDVEVVITKGG